MQVCKYAHICKYASMQVCKYTSMQVCKYASMNIYENMQVCKYASMQVCMYVCVQVVTYMQVCNNVSMNVCKYACLYKKLNKKRDRARPYPRLRDFFKRRRKKTGAVYTPPHPAVADRV